MGYRYSTEEIKKKVNFAIGFLRKNDSFLLDNDIGERTISHKLAEYLQTEFPDWNVDCEYKLKALKNKTLQDIPECAEQNKMDKVDPAIIIHLRNTGENLLVIEVKKGRRDECDFKKLEIYTNQTGEYKYGLGLFIQFQQLSHPILIWFKNGLILF